ncbi:APC amino acid permease [Schizopora paradoxa]|uniref:APC amino acid permease n=1 Tax=Schizopora paradoxa TaxID=27342 RepID=A0A0H2RFK1_9AGAM|nr:APC amino acid permease [Schizopora paradoxa]
MSQEIPVDADSDSSLRNGFTTRRDEAELARMGYKQELKRELSVIQNFGVSFSIISIITGVPSLFQYGLVTGGPAVMVWSWLVVACFTMAIGLAMAEICSAHPTSGGPYFWAAMLSPTEIAPFASWITGWFNLLGQIAVTTGISFACADFISTVATFQTDFTSTPATNIGVYAAVLVGQGLVNTFGVRLLKHLNNFSIWWHIIGTVTIVIGKTHLKKHSKNFNGKMLSNRSAILAAAPSHQSGHFVFSTFIDRTGVDGVGWSERASPAYVVVIGILMSQYSLTGFDASAHMSEETHNAATSGSYGIISAIGASALKTAHDFGFRVQVIVIGAMFMCGTFSVTSNSRMMYAFARDGGLPGHKFFRVVSAERKSPTRAVWLACALSFMLGLPSLGSTVAFSAATSIATIGLYVSYAIPIALRVVYRRAFVRGPFHLGPFSYPIAVTATIWIAFISIAFILPQENPVNSQTLNYAVVAVGIVVAYSLSFWFISARKWFKGPIKQISGQYQSRFLDEFFFYLRNPFDFSSSGGNCDK